MAIVLALTTAMALWCATEYLGGKPRQIETREELLQTRVADQPISDQDIEVHVSRVGHQAQKWGIASALASAAAFGALACLLAASRK